MNHYLILKLRNASIDCDQHGQGNLAALLSEAIQEIEKLSGGGKLTSTSRSRATLTQAEIASCILSGRAAAQSEPATRAVPVGKVLSDQEMFDANIDGKSGNVIWLGSPQPGYLYAAPTPGAERHVANHAGNLEGEQGRRITHLEAVAAEYNDLIVHMNAGGDFHEFMFAINAAPAQPTDKENGK